MGDRERMDRSKTDGFVQLVVHSSGAKCIFEPQPLISWRTPRLLTIAVTFVHAVGTNVRPAFAQHGRRRHHGHCRHLVLPHPDGPDFGRILRRSAAVEYAPPPPLCVWDCLNVG